MRRRFIQDPDTLELIPAEQYARPQTNEAAMVMGDIQPYRSHIDGSLITTRSQHRAHLRSHGCVEVGNELDAAMRAAPRARPSSEQRKRQIAEVWNHTKG